MTAADFRAWRARLRLTQPAAGKALGLSRATIAKYESGDNPVPLAIELACEALTRRAEDAA